MAIGPLVGKPNHAASVKVAIIGSGNIGTDLMIKVMRTSDVLEMGALVGIDPEFGRPQARRPDGCRHDA